MEDDDSIEKVVVTKHQELADYLRMAGIIDEGVDVIRHPTAEDVWGKHVIGEVSFRLAAQAEKVTEIPIHVPPELRGKNLSLEQLQELIGPIRTFRVLEGEAWRDFVISRQDKLNKSP